MLDAVACSAMELGDPRVTVAALRILHQLLVDRRLRGNSPDDSTVIVREKRNEQSAKRRSSRSAVHRADTVPDELNVRHHRAPGDEHGATHERNQVSRKAAHASRRNRHSEGV